MFKVGCYMDKYEKNIGKHIREVRLERGLSQERLADMCDFSNTTLSAYENSRKIPNLSTIAKIAKQLNVSVERLYYGDENSAFINSEPDVGRKIVNSIYFLWESRVIDYFENYISHGSFANIANNDSLQGAYLFVYNYAGPIKRFINSLNEFRNKAETYSDPEQYLEMLKTSVATEINRMNMN